MMRWRHGAGLVSVVLAIGCVDGPFPEAGDGRDVFDKESSSEPDEVSDDETAEPGEQDAVEPVEPGEDAIEDTAFDATRPPDATPSPDVSPPQDVASPDTASPDAVSDADPADDADDAAAGTVRIDRVLPGEIDGSVENAILVQGEGFRASDDVTIGDLPVDEAEVDADGRGIRVVVSAGALEEGFHTVRVIDEGGVRAERERALFVFTGDGSSAVRIDRVEPSVVRIDRTVDLRVTGAGFEPGLRVLVGSAQLTNTQVGADGTFASALLPGGLLPEPGAYTVRVVLESGETAARVDGLLVVPAPREESGCSTLPTRGTLPSSLLFLLALTCGRGRRRVV